jgi:hypothetical protein
MCVYVCVCVRACDCACVCMCMYVRAYMCVCVWVSCGGGMSVRVTCKLGVCVYMCLLSYVEFSEFMCTCNSVIPHYAKPDQVLN